LAYKQLVGSEKHIADSIVFTFEEAFQRKEILMIRDFDEKVHLAGVQACLIELQDYERSLDPRLPSGAEIVDDYIPRMLHRCRLCDGRVLVAEVNEQVAGFATILAKVTSEEIEEGDFEYGLVSDLIVASKYRKQGIGRQLLAAAESYARSSEVRWLRIGVLAENHHADALYDSMGFKKLYIEREKELAGPK
jgi:ribosomal protein S18 acetylase RimI-like enzyme